MLFGNLDYNIEGAKLQSRKENLSLSLNFKSLRLSALAP